jgi:hypothetical protein
MTPGRGPVPITILIVFVVARVAAASQQPDPEQQLVGSSRLTGRVIAADNGKPVRRAYVNISRPNTSGIVSFDRITGWSVQTDSKGQFEVAHLPAGSYYITVDPVSGFLRSSRTTYATLVEGGTAQVTISVVRAGAIEGRVRDEHGDPVLGAQVHAMRRINIGGYIELQGSLRAMTDDRGRFRIFNVAPGEHDVVATYMPPHRDLDDSPLLGYTNTYYPGSLTPNNARHVVVRGGRDTQRVDLTLATRRLVKVSVRAIDSRGVPLEKEAWLHLTRRDPVSLPTSDRSGNPLKDGTVVFDGITPGDYYVIATTNYRLDEAAFVNVTVGDKDVSLNVQTNAGARISGRMIVDGRPVGEGDDAASGRMNVSVSASRPLRQGGFAYAKDALVHPQGSDRFELSGLRGPTALNASLGGGTLVSIRRGEQNIAGKTLDLIGTETIDDVVIEFTRKTAQVDVTVTGTRTADDLESVMIVLFADDPSLWHYGHVQYSRPTMARSARQSDKEKAEPHTTLSRLVPGAYRVIAIRDPEVYYPTQAAILEKLRPFATPVTLVAGQPAQISIGVTKLGR